MERKGCGRPNCSVCGKNGNMGLFESIGDLIDGSGIGMIPVGMTSISIGSDGKVQYVDRGMRTECVPLSSIDGIDPSVEESLLAFKKLASEISVKRNQARELTTEADAWQDDINERRVQLKFGISKKLPSEHASLYGNDDLTLIEDDDRLMLTTTGEAEGGFEVDKETFGPFFDEQQSIETLAQNVADNRSKAEQLKLEAEKDPELLERCSIAARLAFETHVVPHFRGDKSVMMLAPTFSEDGEIEIEVTRFVTKESDTVPQDELDLISVLSRIETKRSGRNLLPPFVRELLGISEPPEKIEASASESTPVEETAGQS